MKERYPGAGLLIVAGVYVPPIRKDSEHHRLLAKKNFPYSASPQDHIGHTSELPTQHFIRMYPSHGVYAPTSIVQYPI